MINSILWNNSQQQIHLNLSSITVTYSNIQGGYTGTSNIDADPLFVDPANGDYHLTENSPCIDTGDPDPQYNDLDGTFADIGAYYFYHLAPPVANFTSDKISGMVPLTVNFTDITSHGSGVIDEWYWDFGDGTNSSLQHPAHVYQSQGVYSVSLIVTADDDSTDTMAKTDYITVTDRIWYISTTGSNTTGDGSEEFPFKTIQHGIDVSSNTDIVLVQPGTYVENINYNGKRITLGSLFLTTQDTTYISSTIIDGDASGSVVIFESSENLLAILTGFTITNGGTTDGGGIFCDHASPTLKNLIILDNTATDDGGGIFCDHASPTLKNLKVAGNSANSSGGGIYCAYYSSPSIESVEILNNSADWGGGIFIVNFSNPSLENVNISNNFAVHNGGGIYIEGISNPNLESVSIINNTAGYVGGIACYSSEPSIRNTTIANNYATYRVGGIHCGNNAYPTLENVTITGNDTGSSRDCIILSDSYSCPNLINTILWHNNYHYDIAGPFTATYSNIESGFIGTGNISSDPLFVDVANGDYHLQPTSPSIDTGDPNSPLDPDGSRADMGAYYYHQYDIPPTAKFNSNLSQGYSPLSVDFTDISTHGSVEIDEWYWDFGDGENSTVQNPTHIFSDLGYYTISLTVTDVNDSTDTEIKTDFIAVSADEQPAAPANVNISNTGNDVILNWDKVDTSVLGNFVYTDYYLIYNSASPNSNYSFLDLTTETNYTHQHITQFGDKNFYQVSAYVGELRLLQSVIAENPNFKLGELDFLIEEKRKRNSLK